MKTLSNFKKMQPLIIWGVGVIYFILAITVTVMFGVLSPDLQKQLNLTSAQLGFLGFGFFLSFGVTQLLTGGLIDSWGPRIALTLSACVAATGLFLLSTAGGFNQAFLAQVITAAGLSTSYVGAIYLASMWFSQKYFSLLSGMTQMASNIMSATLITLMALVGAGMMDFRIAMSALAIFALVMAFLFFLIVRRSPESIQSKEAEKQKSIFWKDLYKLVHIPQFWLGSLYFSTNISVFLAFSSLWNVPDSIAFGRDLKTATMLSATLRFGSALGAVLAGLIAGYLGRCSSIVRCYSSGALLFGAVLIYGHTFPVAIVFLLFFVLGFFFGGTALGFPLVGQYIPPTLRGTGFGLMAAMGYLFSALLQYLVGILLGNQVLPGSLPSIYDFRIALLPLLMMLAIGWFCTLWLRDAQQAKA